MEQKYFDCLIDPFYKAIGMAFGRIISTENDNLSVSNLITEYVISGRQYDLVPLLGNSETVFRFWIGVNVDRLFFITYIAEVTTEEAKEKFKFTFGGAEKVGWQMQYERIDGGVSIWGVCVAEDNLCAFSETIRVDNMAVAQLTKRGLFWATDIAMMAQSFVRTCEREGIATHSLAPAPL